MQVTRMRFRGLGMLRCGVGNHTAMARPLMSPNPNEPLMSAARIILKTEVRELMDKVCCNGLNEY